MEITSEMEITSVFVCTGAETSVDSQVSEVLCSWLPLLISLYKTLKHKMLSWQ